MDKPTLHLIAPFHTIPNHDYDHCAFTGKALRFSKMMKEFDYHIIEYSNGESISSADEKIQILTKDEVINFVGEPTSLNALHGRMETPIYTEFHKRLKEKIVQHVKPNDIILHPYGHSHSELLELIPYAFHVESGIGYVGREFGAIRIFDSYTWMHYLLGSHVNLDENGQVAYKNGWPSTGKWPDAYHFAVPNYLDVEEWTPSYEKGEYLLYIGRIIEEKGLYIVKEIAERHNEPIKIAGLGDVHKFQGKNMDFIGAVTGDTKLELFKKAKAILVPTQYVEPFGIVVIEAMMSGTPVISSDFGAFVETVDHGKTGYRCRTLGDYLAAISSVEKLDRKYIADHARERWSYETVGKRYDEIFKQIYDLRNSGWYSTHTHLKF